ncbi:sensor histidine kinase [Comamonadaceae bacterium OH2545_COT-014]|nr:sensor histidine kinase [Comamonadaceae bacterium OH2545_COT-014]
MTGLRPSSPPAAAPVPAPEWMEATQFRRIMRSQSRTQGLALVVACLLWLLMAEHVPGHWLAAWMAMVVSTAIIRWQLGRQFERQVKPQGIAAQLHFQRQHRWIWVVYGLTWGLSPLLFCGRIEANAELTAWLLMACVAGVAVFWMAVHPGTARLFLVSLFLGATFSAAMTSWPYGGRSAWHAVHPWLPGLVLLHGLAMLALAARLARRYRHRIERYWRSQRLIETLQQQTHAVTEKLDEQQHLLLSAVHDLRQPLHALGIYADWLNAEPEMAAELAPRIRRATHAVNAMFDELFDLSRLDAGQLQVQRERLDVNALLTALQAQFEPLAARKGLALRVRQPAGVVQAESDRVMLQRILGNLLSNAIRYTPQGGVLLAVRRRAGLLVFEVWDTGAGIAASEMEHIFQAFYRVRDASAGEGAGLGLAIVRRLADALGASVTVRSSPGRGTVFRLSLPLA